MRLLRRTYIINPRLQLRLIFVANVLALISLSITATLAIYTQRQFDDYLTMLVLCSVNQAAIDHIAQGTSNFGVLCLVIGIAQLALFNLMALILSHRISGPLYRLERHLEDVGAGKAPADVQFRKGDLYESLATACNRVMARMRSAGA